MIYTKLLTTERIEAIPRKYPLFVEVDLANICNHNCSWCEDASFRKTFSTCLKSECVFSLLTDLKNCGVEYVVFTGGGEPTLHTGFDKFVLFARELGLKVIVYTNGEKLFEKRKILEQCEYVQVSLDAATPEVHKRFHKGSGNSFSLILHGINKLSGKIAMGISFLIHSGNYFEIPQIITLSQSLGVKRLLLKPVRKKGFVLSPSLVEKSTELYRDTTQKCIISTQKLEIYYNLEYYQDIEIEKCYVNNFVGVVCADSRLYVCPEVRGVSNLILGDLRVNTFCEIWDSERKKKVVSLLDTSRCPPCRFRELNRIISLLRGGGMA